MFIIYLLIGIASGILGAMGVGGGSISILVLSGFMGVDQKNSQLINLFAFVIPAVTAIIIHSKHKLIDKYNVIFTVLGGIPTAILGSFIAARLSSSVLKTVFGVFLLILGVFEIFNKKVYNIIDVIKERIKKSKTERC